MAKTNAFGIPVPQKKKTAPPSQGSVLGMIFPHGRSDWDTNYKPGNPNWLMNSLFPQGSPEWNAPAGPDPNQRMPLAKGAPVGAQKIPMAAATPSNALQQLAAPAGKPVSYPPLNLQGFQPSTPNLLRAGGVGNRTMPPNVSAGPATNVEEGVIGNVNFTPLVRAGYNVPGDAERTQGGSQYPGAVPVQARQKYEQQTAQVEAQQAKQQPPPTATPQAFATLFNAVRNAERTQANPGLVQAPSPMSKQPPAQQEALRGLAGMPGVGMTPAQIGQTFPAVTPQDIIDRAAYLRSGANQLEALQGVPGRMTGMTPEEMDAKQRVIDNSYARGAQPNVAVPLNAEIAASAQRRQQRQADQQRMLDTYTPTRKQGNTSTGGQGYRAPVFADTPDGQEAQRRWTAFQEDRANQRSAKRGALYDDPNLRARLVMQRAQGQQPNVLEAIATRDAMQGTGGDMYSNPVLLRSLGFSDEDMATIMRDRTARTGIAANLEGTKYTADQGLRGTESQVGGQKYIADTQGQTQRDVTRTQTQSQEAIEKGNQQIAQEEIGKKYSPENAQNMVAAAVAPFIAQSYAAGTVTPQASRAFDLLMGRGPAAPGAGQESFSGGPAVATGPLGQLNPIDQQRAQEFIDNEDWNGLARVFLANNIVGPEVNSFMENITGKAATLQSPGGEWFPGVNSALRAIGVMKDPWRGTPNQVPTLADLFSGIR